MKEFDYDLDYKNLDFSQDINRKYYRIGRGEQGVLLVEPYKSDICKYWKFATLEQAKVSASTIFEMFQGYRDRKDFIGMDMCRKFLEMGFTRSRRYANHKDGKKYDENRNIIPQEKDALTSEKALCARVFKSARDMAVEDPIYQKMRKYWRANEA
jgi:hypothetical protein|tara:strand:+ start:283 stop:747 length:465 start_codon:yes stop_codon:yes gene_type:complete